MTEMRRLFERRWRFLRDHPRPSTGEYIRHGASKAVAWEWFEQGAMAHMRIGLDLKVKLPSVKPNA
jgi:hypothetical protein